MTILKFWPIFWLHYKEVKICQNFKMVISENHYCGFVGDVKVDSGLTLYTHKPLFDCSRTYLNFENSRFFPKNVIFSNFDHFADMADFNKKKLGKCAEG